MSRNSRYRINRRHPGKSHVGLKTLQFNGLPCPHPTFIYLSRFAIMICRKIKSKPEVIYEGKKKKREKRREINHLQFILRLHGILSSIKLLQDILADGNVIVPRQTVSLAEIPHDASIGVCTLTVVNHSSQSPLASSAPSPHAPRSSGSSLWL